MIEIIGIAGDLVENTLKRAIALARAHNTQVTFAGNHEWFLVASDGSFSNSPHKPPMSAKIIRCWIFASSSDPDKTYETLEYSDSNVYCSCPSWTRRVAPDGSRSCRHVRLVHMGRAHLECVSMMDCTTDIVYGMTDGSEVTQQVEPIHIPQSFSKPSTTTKGNAHGTKKIKTTNQSTFGEFGGRSIIK